MGLTTAAVGGFIGFTAQCMSNSIQKIPLSRHPWMHVLCSVGGAWAAHKYVAFKAKLLSDINEVRSYKGLPPVVGTHHYLPFVPPNLESSSK